MHHLATLALLALSTPLLAQGFTCSSSLHGLGCGGSLDVTFAPVGAGGNQTLTVRAYNLHPNEMGVMVFGVIPAMIEITPGCIMWEEFSWGHLVNVDSLGEWSWSRSWPASVNPLFYFIQVGSFVIDGEGNLELRATDAKRAQCQ
jgi:hypothetical protein